MALVYYNGTLEATSGTLTLEWSDILGETLTGITNVQMHVKDKETDVSVLVSYNTTELNGLITIPYNLSSVDTTGKKCYDYNDPVFNFVYSITCTHGGKNYVLMSGELALLEAGV
jgi:hypothetical protein